ncbi:GH36 C-terminal domain-containing protein [Paenibacillus dakarensis]|uniref:GH36 C-terminal domain-containing protein n=1 Tax=Paenibacillus dakarensis TaxID=1527293 RepID=UPI0006D542C5
MRNGPDPVQRKEKELAKEQVRRYKEIRGLVQQGELYRLVSPFAGHEAAWMFVSDDRSEALVIYFKVLAEPNAPQRKLQLKGLNPALSYQAEDSGLVLNGDRLMEIVLTISTELGDHYSYSVHLKAVNSPST